MITLTESAQTKIFELRNDTKEHLRVSVRPGGCSGYSYEMFFDSEISETDEVSSYGEIKVVVDEASIPLLEGASLDFIDDLNNSGFKLTNPNATRTCGCGDSFS